MVREEWIKSSWNNARIRASWSSPAKGTESLAKGGRQWNRCRPRWSNGSERREWSVLCKRRWIDFAKCAGAFGGGTAVFVSRRKLVCPDRKDDTEAGYPMGNNFTPQPTAKEWFRLQTRPYLTPSCPCCHPPCGPCMRCKPQLKPTRVSSASQNGHAVFLFFELPSRIRHPSRK